MPNNLMLNFRDLKQKSDNLKITLFSNHIRILIIVIYLAGLWLGTMLYINNGYISSVAKNGIDYLITAEYVTTLMVLLAVKAGTISAIFISGFSACGLPASVGLPCIYGIVCGVINSCIYSTYKLNGIFFSLIIIVPLAVITSLLITALSDNAINLTKKLVKALTFGEADKRGEAKTYIYSGLIIIAIECAVDLLQAFIISKTGEFILTL